MTSLLRAAVAFAAVLSLVVAAGCGGSSTSSDDYVSALNKAQADFASNVKKVGSSSSQAGSDPTANAKKTFSDLSAATDKVIADLKAVQAPDKVKALHNQLISEMSEFGAQVKAAGNSLDSKDPKTILSAQSKFATSASSLGARISKTIGDINAKLQG
jgi:hypothetical protein